MRAFILSLILFISAFTLASADTIEGRLASLEKENRLITLSGGETMHLIEPVPMEDLAIGQLLRLEFESGTVEVTSVLVLEQAPPPTVDEEPVIEQAPE